MAINSGNINASGQVLQTYLKRRVLENFEPMLRMYQMGDKPVWDDGYYNLAWTRMQRLTITPAQAALQEGVTPNATNTQMETIQITAKEYGMYVTLSTYLLRVSAINVLNSAATEVASNMARIIDEVIQDNLATNGTNVIYANNQASRSALTSSDTALANDLAKINAFLATKAAPEFWDGYVGVMHPNVIYDLQVQTGTGTFIDLNKYTGNVTKVFNGEIGKLYNIRIVKSAYIQTFASNVTVFPSYIMGRGAYGVANLQNLTTYRTPMTASDSDPLSQRVKVGAKVAFESIILQQDALVRYESASALNYTFI